MMLCGLSLELPVNCTGASIARRSYMVIGRAHYFFVRPLWKCHRLLKCQKLDSFYKMVLDLRQATGSWNSTHSGAAIQNARLGGYTHPPTRRTAGLLRARHPKGWLQAHVRLASAHVVLDLAPRYFYDTSWPRSLAFTIKQATRTQTHLFWTRHRVRGDVATRLIALRGQRVTDIVLYVRAWVQDGYL